MTKIRLALATALILGVTSGELRAAPPSDDQATTANLDILVNAIRSNRKAFVAVNLELTDEEATKFWPIYDRYQKEIDAVGDRLLAVIQDYTASFNDLSNDKAMNLIDDYLTIEADRIKVRRSYVEEVATALPGRKVARFYQLENKMDAVIRYDIAATIPVIEQEKSAPTK